MKRRNKALPFVPTEIHVATVKDDKGVLGVLSNPNDRRDFGYSIGPGSGRRHHDRYQFHQDRVGAKELKCPKDRSPERSWEAQIPFSVFYLAQAS